MKDGPQKQNDRVGERERERMTERERERTSETSKEYFKGRNPFEWSMQTTKNRHKTCYELVSVRS